MSEGHLKRSNMLWEGSRMMLPEHKEQILGHRRCLTQRSKPLPDEQRLEEWSHVLAAGMVDGREIAVTVYDPDGDTHLQGTVEKMDPVLRQFKLVREGQPVWVRLVDVTSVDWP